LGGDEEDEDEEEDDAPLWDKEVEGKEAAATVEGKEAAEGDAYGMLLLKGDDPTVPRSLSTVVSPDEFRFDVSENVILRVQIVSVIAVDVDAVVATSGVVAVVAAETDQFGRDHHCIFHHRHVGGQLIDRSKKTLLVVAPPWRFKTLW